MNSLIGAAAGGGLMYILDPVSGARRRSLARDRVEHARRQVTEGTGTVLIEPPRGWQDAGGGMRRGRRRSKRGAPR